MSIFGVFLVRIFKYSAEYREILCISPYSVGMRENADQNNSEYGHFLRSVVVAVFSLVHYDTLLQKATDITKKWDSYFISKCNKSLLQSASCFFLIKSAIVLLQDKM